MKKYLPRIADDILKNKLKSKGAVLVQGPKWCGKSTTSVRQSKSAVYMQDPSTKDQNIMLAKANSNLFLEGKTPKLIDEWQIIPFIWDAIRFEVDKRDKFGQFILTGSATPISTKEITHTGIGRITRLTMRTMSLYESQDSTGEVSLEKLFKHGYKISGTSSKDLKDIAFLICRGGWPKAIGQSKKIALQQAIDYYDELINTDISKVDGIKRDKNRTINLLRAYSRNISSQANITTLKNDIINNDVSTLSEDTISSYINALKQLFVIEDLSAWNPNLRSKTAIRTLDTRHFVDPSIATSALGIGPKDLINDLKTFGLLFEDMCIRDLRVYAEKIDGTVYHYRDKNGLEVDAVIHLRNGNYGLVEAKLFSQDNIDEAAKNLLKLKNNIDTTKMKAPSFLMVLTGTEYAYKRSDGVIVCPITCLKN